MNKTLMKTVRSMLADAKLPQKFWAEALSTAVYLRNRSPMEAVKGMTPFEAWTGEKPNVDYCIYVYLDVLYMDMYPKMNRRNLIPKQINVSFWSVEQKQKNIDSMIQNSQKCSKVINKGEKTT